MTYAFIAACFACVLVWYWWYMRRIASWTPRVAAQTPAAPAPPPLPKLRVVLYPAITFQKLPGVTTAILDEGGNVVWRDDFAYENVRYMRRQAEETLALLLEQHPDWLRARKYLDGGLPTP